jgi:hypothetical protein
MIYIIGVKLITGQNNATGTRIIIIRIEVQKCIGNAKYKESKKK